MDDITIVIKTFERKKSLICLLRSIQKYYPDVFIIIVDDSKKSYREEILNSFRDLNINYIVTEFDIGLSEGRNILLRNVKTKYFMLCDDDFEFDKRTDINKAIQILKNNDIDILGGAIYEKVEINSIISLLLTAKSPKRILKFLLQHESIRVYNGYFNINDNRVIGKFNSNPKDFSDSEFYRVDIVTNFFIAKTDRIKSINGWQPKEVKLGEHTIFFIRCKQNNINVAFTLCFGVKHHPYMSLDYYKYRNRGKIMFKIGMKSLCIKSYKAYDMNNVLISEYEDDQYEK